MFSSWKVLVKRAKPLIIGITYIAPLSNVCSTCWSGCKKAAGSSLNGDLFPSKIMLHQSSSLEFTRRWIEVTYIRTSHELCIFGYGDLWRKTLVVLLHRYLAMFRATLYTIYYTLYNPRSYDQLKNVLVNDARTMFWEHRILYLQSEHALSS